jgi:hypothetical protein
MILNVERKTISKGKTLTSDKMEVNENLLSIWLLNRVDIPQFKDRVNMMKFITAMSLLTEPVSSDLFGPVDFFYDKNKSIVNTFKISVSLINGTKIEIVGDKFSPWGDDMPEGNQVLRNILQDEKNEKLTVKDYSSYSYSSREDGLFVYEALCVDTFITFLSTNYLNSANKSFLNWYDSQKK